jgi:predicted RNase H-like HicB family nuclease
MKLRVVVEYDPEAKSYAVYCPELPGCTSAGDSEDEAIENIKEAILLYLEPSPIKLSATGKIFEIQVPA